MEELTAPTEEEAQELLRLTVSDGYEPQPVIVTLYNPQIGLMMDHAVVMTRIEQVETESGVREIIEYMDPLTGYIETDTSGLFWVHWYYGRFRALLIRP